MEHAHDNSGFSQDEFTLHGAKLASVQDWFQRMSLMVSHEGTLEVFDAKTRRFIAPEDIADIGDPEIKFSAVYRDRARSMYDLSIMVMRSTTERVSLTLEQLTLEAHLMDAGSTERTTGQQISNGGTLTFRGLMSDRVYKFSPAEPIFKHATLPTPIEPPELEERVALEEPRELPNFKEVRFPRRRSAS